MSNILSGFHKMPQAKCKDTPRHARSPKASPGRESHGAGAAVGSVERLPAAAPEAESQWERGGEGRGGRGEGCGFVGVGVGVGWVGSELSACFVVSGGLPEVFRISSVDPTTCFLLTSQGIQPDLEKRLFEVKR